MSIDLDKIKSKLEKLQSQSKGNGNGGGNILWKPDEGTQVIRIVPYKQNPSNPFIEIYTHFNFGGDTFVSPITYGDPDPIHEFSQELRKQKDEDSYAQSKKFEPKLRTYVPIIVRGEEDKGIKYWGFGKQAYEQLLGYIADPDYGDITHPKTGIDVKIQYEKPANGFPKTNIIVKRKSTPVMEDMEKFKEMYENQPDIKKIFQPMSYSELEKKLKDYLNGGESDEQINTSDSSNDGDSGETTPWDPSNEKDDSDVESTFDELFNS